MLNKGCDIFNFRTLPLFILLFAHIIHPLGNFGGFFPVSLSRFLIQLNTLLCIILFYKHIKYRDILPVWYLAIILVVCSFTSLDYVEDKFLNSFGNMLMPLLATIFAVRIAGLQRTLLAYMMFAQILASVAILQFIVNLMGHDPYEWFRGVGLPETIGNLTRIPRAHGLAPEPAHYAMFTIPALYIALTRVFANRTSLAQFVSLRFACIILLAAILTFSLVQYVYIFIFITFLILFGNSIIGRLLIVIFALMISIAVFNLKENPIIERLTAISQFEGKKDQTSSNIAALATNYEIAIDSLKNTFWFGGGPFTHESRFFERFSWLDKDTALNARDAASLYLRVISEIGVIGAFLTLGVITLLFGHSVLNKMPIAVLFFGSFLMSGIRYGSVDLVMPWLFFSVGWMANELQFYCKSIAVHQHLSR
jgi:hypothetical protein